MTAGIMARVSSWRRPTIDDLARFVTGAASTWFFFCAAWGMFQISGAGHTDSGSIGNLGFSQAIVRFHILYPSDDWFSMTGTPPPPSTYFCHHPFGIFYVTSLFLWIFGNHDYVIHLPAVVLGTCIPPLLYGIGARYRGPVIGAVAACAYVVVPIAVGFANFTNLEVLGIFGSLLFFWGHTAHQQTKRGGHLAASLVGLTLACSSDWCGYALVAPLLGWSFVRAFVLPARWTPRFDFRPYAKWWALSATIAVGTFFLWIALFYKADKIGDWIASGITRGSDGSTLKSALEARKNWIDFSFTPLAIAIGKFAAPLALLRLVLLRRDEEAYSLSILFGAVVEYVAFKKGADVHIFWPHYFAAYFALAMAQLASTAGGLAAAVGRMAGRRPRTAALAGAWVALVVGMIPVAAMTPDAVRSLPVWRRTGGRYDDKGALIRTDIDELFVLENVVGPHQPRGALVDANPSVNVYWEEFWALRGGTRPQGDPAPASASASAAHANEPYWIARASGLGSGDQLRIAAMAHVRAYGDLWVVDQREASPAPIDAANLVERDPGPLEWLAYGNWEPMRILGPGTDPLKTWDWRVHLNQPGPTPTPRETRDIEELRILHNAAVYAGETGRAELLREKIEGQLDRSVETAFEGMKLVGVRVTRGAQPRLEVWFVTSTRPKNDAMFRVRSANDKSARFSLIPPDTTDREMAFGPRIPTKLWRPGFFYKIDVVLNHRIGVERYWGAWSAGGPARLDGRPDTTLAIIP
jgi:Dolichyl-phosphate-mannose-protein mannosyltransferase